MQKKPLFIIMGLFIAPIVIAKLVLVNDWYQGAKTNTGKLLSPPLTMSQPPQAWLLLYNPGNRCAQQCQQSLWQIQQVHTLLAAEGTRVQRYLTKYPVTVIPPENLSHDHVEISALTRLQLSEVNQNLLSTDTLYLVDPHGNIFMHYQYPADRTAATKVSAGLLKDVKRLLKISKIG
ncbi:hypothetical protein [Moritella viscosa]|uniref:Transmembrane cytochrome oxidase associated protein n=1 Tax=Moritella viscosa TaxID=80854 RepID=A0A090IFN6_9GAMM|nr:hypothetical protein [Moritella viscosa]CED61340.1 membrane protein [Moritella viscosa]SGY88586.1 Putative uncharacterized protein [Moritella viscosa]SGY92038.1 Putative uncharacterized protein [Moritella viscosa]SGY95647.1 Putative uncharacterized protein [Moritella viscosa]SGY95778.1 Putative uncharacterized protein [Moritella viscosa]